MLPRPERRGESCCERRVSAEQADYLQGEDREGVSHPHAARSPLILCFLAVSKGSHSAWTSKGQTRPWHG